MVNEEAWYTRIYTTYVNDLFSYGKAFGFNDEELMDACKGFETYFVQKIIEQARKMVKSEEDDSEYMQYFGDTLNQSYAEAITESGQVGLAKQLYDSMKRN